MNIRDGYAMKVAVESGYNVSSLVEVTEGVRLIEKELQIFIWAP
jgi:hypothetical protein